MQYNTLKVWKGFFIHDESGCLIICTTIKRSENTTHTHLLIHSELKKTDLFFSINDMQGRMLVEKSQFYVTLRFTTNKNILIAICIRSVRTFQLDIVFKKIEYGISITTIEYNVQQ